MAWKLFEDPTFHQCFTAYPQVKHLVEKESYLIFKKEKEVSRDIPWNRLIDELKKTSDKSGITIQRYKGLGEMTAEQLWETTMNPSNRTLLTVTIEDFAKADEMFQKLMGEEVYPRKAFIQAYAKTVRNLDI